MTIDLATIRDYAAHSGLPESTAQRIVVEEAFFRRAALVDGPFMLKGSYVTRQQIDQGWRRIPGDLDWVGLEQVDAGVLTAWVTAVTETCVDDGIRFRSFAENAFWRMIEYAMDDDFPTVNTDIVAWIGEHQLASCKIDVSFGLKLQPPPRPLLYQPRFGAPFVLQKSVATELQMAWKLHQCLVRPRFKDLMDLILVLRANTVDVNLVWTALEDECRHDKTPVEGFNRLLDRTIAEHPAWKRLTHGRYSAAECFSVWRSTRAADSGLHLFEPSLEELYVGGRELLWEDFEQCVAELAMLLQRAGFVRVAPADTGSVQQAAPVASTGVIDTLARWFGRRD
ncbi:nucleotidyl transferase AbiEii/AbiGii toxin family protein [Massilia frigida]|nr:nucleotidyl transferase AbiEii/AbiGii toxin family protein [Massilia frigida]